MKKLQRFFAVIIIYNYFNLSDADFSSTHTRTNLAVNLPECNGSAYSNLEELSGDSNMRTTPEDTNIEPEVPETPDSSDAIESTPDAMPEKESKESAVPDSIPESSLPNNAMPNNKQMDSQSGMNINGKQMPASPGRP